MSDLYQFMKNWNPGMGLNDKFREDTLELMNAARAEGYMEALEDGEVVPPLPAVEGDNNG